MESKDCTERGRYLSRLRSYKASWWPGWRSKCKPTICSAWGWRCIDVGKLRCDGCSNTLNDAGDGELACRGLKDAHVATCRWKRSILDEEEERSVPGPTAGLGTDALEDWESRARELEQLPWLPEIKLPEDWNHDKQSNDSKGSLSRAGKEAYVLSTFGWEVRHLPGNLVMGSPCDRRPKLLEKGDPKDMHSSTMAASWTFRCRLCGAEVGAWKFAPSGQYRSLSSGSPRVGRKIYTIAGGMLGARVGGTPISKEEGIPSDIQRENVDGLERMDVVGLHRYYCEWIVGTSPEHPAGWIVLSRRLQERDLEGTTLDATGGCEKKRKREWEPEEALARARRVLREASRNE